MQGRETLHGTFKESKHEDVVIVRGTDEADESVARADNLED